MSGSWGRSLGGDLSQAAAGWRLASAAREPDQAMRLARFRNAHPEVIIGDGGFGTWQARIPEPDGEQIFTRHLLRELIDKLCEFFSRRAAQEGNTAPPGGDHAGGPSG